jgi:hypothetical protein
MPVLAPAQMTRQTRETPDGVTVAKPQDPERAVRILAKTLYRDLRGQGFDSRHVIALATELIAQVTSSAVAEGATPAAPEK